GVAEEGCLQGRVAQGGARLALTILRPMDKTRFCRSAPESKSRDSKWCDAAAIALLSWLLILPGSSPGRPLYPGLKPGWTVIQTFQRQEDCQRAAKAMRSEAYAGSAVDLGVVDRNNHVALLQAGFLTRTAGHHARDHNVVAQRV